MSFSISAFAFSSSSFFCEFSSSRFLIFSQSASFSFFNRFIFSLLCAISLFKSSILFKNPPSLFSSSYFCSLIFEISSFLLCERAVKRSISPSISLCFLRESSSCDTAILRSFSHFFAFSRNFSMFTMAIFISKTFKTSRRSRNFLAFSL